ncbi:MAG: hypothetical protein FWF51_11165 [Chitinivibrionia bacterium]|nr:hypothetical protein [Chitinivibrionia bacterium]
MKTKNLIAGIAVISCMLFTGCGDKAVDFKELQQRGNVYVWAKNQKPYSGRFITYYSDGSIAQSGSMKKGVLDGQVVENSIGGSSEVTNYKNGNKHGKHELFNAKGELAEQTNYKMGALNGKYIVYEAFMSMDEDELSTDAMEAFSNTLIKIVEFFKFAPDEEPVYLETTYKDDELHGKWTYKSKVGEKTGTFKNGKPDGEFISIRNGSEESRKYFLNGKEKDMTFGTDSPTAQQSGNNAADKNAIVGVFHGSLDEGFGEVLSEIEINGVKKQYLGDVLELMNLDYTKLNEIKGKRIKITLKKLDPPLYEYITEEITSAELAK